MMDQLGYIWHDTSHNHLNVNAKFEAPIPVAPDRHMDTERDFILCMHVCSSLGVTILSLVSAMNIIWHLHCWHSQEPCDGSWTAKIIKQTLQLNTYKCTDCCVYCFNSKGNVIYEFGLWTKKVWEPLLWRLDIALPSAITFLYKLL